MTDTPTLHQPKKERQYEYDHQYQPYALDEDTSRSAYHYEQDSEFYYIYTGGEWNVYSCLLWEEGFTITQAQEKKLDKLAELIGLEQGMHILDVGCGWGGPLVYLCQKYGATGHGIAVSTKQVAAARERAAQHGVNATFEVQHWEQLPEVEMFDAIYSDEAIVHFHNLGSFFAKCHTLLKPGRLMAHKELHLTHSSYGVLGPTGEYINKGFAYTGNYITLHQQLQLQDEQGFQLEQIYEIPITNYNTTLDV